MADATDTSETLLGKRNRAMGDTADYPDVPHGKQETRCRVGDLHLAIGVDKEIAEEHTQ